MSERRYQWRRSHKIDDDGTLFLEALDDALDPYRDLAMIAANFGWLTFSDSDQDRFTPAPTIAAAKAACLEVLGIDPADVIQGRHKIALEDRRDKPIKTMVTAAEQEMIRQAAAADDRNVADWVRLAILNAVCPRGTE